MPRRTDLETILLIGSGPIVIGQACEFDYSGTQACRVLREEGFRVVLVNSNPATIMTDPDFADATYVEPITWEVVARIIEQERPDAVRQGHRVQPHDAARVEVVQRVRIFVRINNDDRDTIGRRGCRGFRALDEELSVLHPFKDTLSAA